MDMVLGIDVGGTSIKVGLFTPEGELLDERKITTTELVSEQAFAAVTGAITEFIAEHDAGPEDVIACGLDVPGPVADDGTLGIIANVELDPKGFVAAFKAAFPQASIAFVNDANAAALGEMWAGTAKGATSCVVIAVGTGVGAGVVANGRLVAGAFGAAGEAGHVTVNRDETRQCGCGRYGCLEQYASAQGIVRTYLEECERRGVKPADVEHATDTLSVFRALADGDECAKYAVEVMCDYLGLVMSQISCIVDPELYLIGGGVAGAFDTFAPMLRERFDAYALKPSRAARIEVASLGNQAAMYGSAYEALRIRRESRTPSLD